MKKDDKDNAWVTVAFAILAGCNALLLVFTLYKLIRTRRIRDHSRHLEILYVSIAIYSICIRHLVRIIWYFDIKANYSIGVYLILEDLPLSPCVFLFPSTLSCLPSPSLGRPSKRRYPRAEKGAMHIRFLFACLLACRVFMCPRGSSR